jgi:hypothetical protein
MPIGDTSGLPVAADARRDNRAYATDLAKSRNVSLEIFRKNGTAVQTPVCVARDGADLMVFTNGDSYKVKRLRRNPKLRIAECDVRGPLKGPWHEATGRLVEEEAEKE